MFKLNLLITASLVVVLAGCQRNTIPDPEPTDETYSGADGADTGAYGGSGMEDGEFFDEDPFAAGELAMVVYFDFDSSDLRPEYADVVNRHAMQLASNSGWSVRLEGHADERGSREYNIGLGERRAQTVRRLLLIQGAQTAQVATVSFGEERPAAEGSTEEAYARNRRVEFKYSN